MKKRGVMQVAVGRGSLKQGEGIEVGRRGITSGG